MAYSTHIDHKRQTYTAAQPLLKGRFVKITAARVGVGSPTVDYAAPGDTNAIGVVETERFEAGNKVAINLLTGEGTVIVAADGAIAAGAVVFGAPNGMVSATGAVRRGIAIDQADATGELIEVLPLSA